MAQADPYSLERFVEAQADVIDGVRGELRAGRKRSHWMWYIFPQLRELGRSPTAQFFGIGSLAEARAFLAHPVLGPRLVECTRYVLATPGRSLFEIFGSPDDLKFHFSMSLFACAANERDGVFAQAVTDLSGGALDHRTLAVLEAQDPTEAFAQPHETIKNVNRLT